MTHAGEEIRLREVGLFRYGFRFLQFFCVFLKHLIPAFALCDVSRRSEDTLKHAVTIIEDGGIVRHDCFFTIASMSREFIVSDLALFEHSFDSRFSTFRIGKIVFKGSTDEFFSRETSQCFHLIIHIRNDARWIGGHERIYVRLNE